MIGPDLPWTRMRQPDQTTCGPSSLVAARMLLDRSYADEVREAESDRFAADVISTHRRATRAIDVAGRLQVPWPRALGTPPWAVARELSAMSGPDQPARKYGWHIALFRPGKAFARAEAGVDEDQPVALYVGNAWAPRHVVLAVGRAEHDAPHQSALWVYDPARGARLEVTRAAAASRGLTFGRWDRLWFVVSSSAASAAYSRLDHIADEREPLVERQERRLHRVHGEPLQVADPVAEGLDKGAHLLAHRGAAHQPVVGVDGHPEAEPGEQPDRVLGDRVRGTGLHVGVRAHLERDPHVPDVRRQPAELDGAVARRR